MATEGNQCTGETALLTSLTTLFVAVKLNETKSIHLNTLADLSRQQFTPDDITHRELRLLQALYWRVNPPTHVVRENRLYRYDSGPVYLHREVLMPFISLSHTPFPSSTDRDLCLTYYNSCRPFILQFVETCSSFRDISVNCVSVTPSLSSTVHHPLHMPLS